MENKRTYTKEELDQVLSWKDLVNLDEEEPEIDFSPLDPGIYPFEVQSVETSNYQGGNSIPPCPMATVKIKLRGHDRYGWATARFYCVKKYASAIPTFFRSVGVKMTKEGTQSQEFMPDWDSTIGTCGYVKVGIHLYKGNEYSEVKYWISKSRIPRGYNEDAETAFNKPFEKKDEAKPADTSGSQSFDSSLGF